MNSSGASRRPAFDLSTDAGRAYCFDYDVERGGFAQLLFNLRGEHLQQFAEMLDRAGAEVAARYYERALLICLDDEPAYQAFINGDYVTDNAIKFALQSLSVEYFHTGIPFDREAAAWRARIGAGRGVLVGVNGAFSGSSTTYAHLGEVRDEWRSQSTDCVRLILPAMPGRHPPAGPLQASLRRLGRDAGVLGARFTPQPGSSAVEVRVWFGESGRKPDPYALGLEQADAQAVLDEIVTQSRGVAFFELGPGRLDVAWAARHPIDGSRHGFQRLAALLVPLLTLPVSATEDAIRIAWRRQQESVRIAQSGASLRLALSDHPERGVCRPGASEERLDALEATLGLTLPDPVRRLLSEVDGASTVDTRPTPEEDVPGPHCVHCDLLSSDQIGAAFCDLISIHDSSIEVDGWEGKRPLNPRLRLADDTLVAWPYLPIAQTSEGGELLVLELSGQGRVLDAFHEHGPSQWRPVYERYVDFIDAYLMQGGCIDAISTQPVLRPTPSSR